MQLKPCEVCARSYCWCPAAISFQPLSSPCLPSQALPEIQLADLPELQQALQAHQQLLGLTDSSSSSSSDPQQLLDTFAWLLSEMGPLEACPSEAAARATFYAACYGPVSVAVPAATRFMAWCGEPEVVAGESLGLAEKGPAAGSCCFGLCSSPQDTFWLTYSNLKAVELRVCLSRCALVCILNLLCRAAGQGTCLLLN
jgi:hypothetical protein